MSERFLYGDHPDLTGVSRILVAKLRNLGDVLLASPLFSVLKDALPHAEIDAYIYRDSQQMLEGHPAINAFHLQDRGSKKRGFSDRLSSESKMLRTIRARRYDMVINLTEGDRGTIAAAISGARIRVGLEHSDSSLVGKRRILTHVVKRPAGPRHTVERDLDALRRIGVFPAPEARSLSFSIPEHARDNIRDQLRQARIEPGQYILLHPTSRWLFKCWTISGGAALIRAINAWGVPIVISGSDDTMERAMIERIAALCPGIPVLDLAGRINLKELGALIEMSRGLFCVDSVPMHIAAALKAPTVVVFGPSSEIEWGPWHNPNAQVITQNFSCRPCGLDGCGGSKVSDCLDTLPDDVVIGAVKRMLERSPSSAAGSFR